MSGRAPVAGTAASGRLPARARRCQRPSYCHSVAIRRRRSGGAFIDAQNLFCFDEVDDRLVDSGRPGGEAVADEHESRTWVFVLDFAHGCDPAVEGRQRFGRDAVLADEVVHVVEDQILQAARSCAEIRRCRAAAVQYLDVIPELMKAAGSQSAPICTPPLVISCSISLLALQHGARSMLITRDRRHRKAEAAHRSHEFREMRGDISPQAKAMKRRGVAVTEPSPTSIRPKKPTP